MKTLPGDPSVWYTQREAAGEVGSPLLCLQGDYQSISVPSLHPKQWGQFLMTNFPTEAHTQQGGGSRTSHLTATGLGLCPVRAGSPQGLLPAPQHHS